VQHQHAAVSGAAPGSSGSRSTSRPSTANAHRQPSSQHLLPKPLHEEDEAARVVAQMLHTLQQPPKTFFASKTTEGASAVVKEKKPRPPSASKRPTSASANGNNNLGNFFAQPSFRRDFLLSTLLQRLTDLAAPFLPGQGQSGFEDEADEQQSAAEKEELWSRLDEQQRAVYQEQFASQLALLVANCQSFAGLASAFLGAPYDASRRQFALHDQEYLELLRSPSTHPSFRRVTDVLSSALGYEREGEAYVLATESDADFRDNVQALKDKLKDLLEGARADQSQQQQQQAAPSPTGKTTHAQKKKQQREQLRAGQEEKEYATASGSGEDTSRSSATDGGEYDDRIDYESVVASLSAKERARFMATPAYQQYLAREARIKAIPSTYSTQQHASHGASFKFVSPFAPHQPHMPPQPARTSLPANAVPTAYDVTGAPRAPSNRVALPAALGPSVQPELNQKHLLAELQSGQPRPAPKTSSTARQTWHSSTAPFASFVLQPAAVDLGAVRKGCTYRAVVSLTNAGSVTGRFQVIQPRPAAERDDLLHLRVLYRPGLVAPGLQRRLEVELYAGTAGELQESIEVRSEQHVFHLPVRATVLSDADFARHQAEAAPGSAAAQAAPSAVSSVHAPHIVANYARDFPASPKRHGPAGPFTLTSTFSAAAGSPAPPTAASGKQANAATMNPLLSTVPRGHFGQTGEVRVHAPGATPHVAQALQKQQAARAAARKQQSQDLSEI